MKDERYDAFNIRNFPTWLHRDFKALCAARAETLREGIIRLIREELKNDEEQE